MSATAPKFDARRVKRLRQLDWFRAALHMERVLTDAENVRAKHRLDKLALKAGMPLDREPVALIGDRIRAAVLTSEDHQGRTN